MSWIYNFFSINSKKNLMKKKNRWYIWLSNFKNTILIIKNTYKYKYTNILLIIISFTLLKNILLFKSTEKTITVKIIFYRALRNSLTKGLSLESYRDNGRSYGMGNTGTAGSSSSSIGNVVVFV